MPKKKTPTVQIDDGEWVNISWTKQREECCDCGLIHSVDFRVADNGQLQFRARRVNK
jgi:hypothetical protein